MTYVYCSSVDKDKSLCNINYTTHMKETAKVFFCNFADFSNSNCKITFNAWGFGDIRHSQIHCPIKNCSKCIIITNDAEIQYSSIYSHSCKLLHIIIKHAYGDISKSLIIAPAYGSLFIDSKGYFYSNTITGTSQNIMINISGTLSEGRNNYINAFNVKGHFNYSCTEGADCSSTYIICSDVCNIVCSAGTWSATGFSGCYNTTVWGINGTSSVNWYCQNDLVTTCLDAKLLCNDPVYSILDMSPWIFDYISGSWFYGKFCCA
eukprot:161169_1